MLTKCAALLALLTACAVQAPASGLDDEHEGYPSGPSGATGATGAIGAIDAPVARIMPIAHPEAATNFPPPPPPPPPSTQLQYFGGKVLSNVHVVTVLWGSKVASATTSQIDGFFKFITTSPWLSWLSEYDTPTQQIGLGTYGGSIEITPGNTSTSLQDSDIQTELAAQIAAGKLPAPDANTLYMTYFPAGISITLQGQASCVAFCAYHGTMIDQKNVETYYGVMPDLGQPGCNQGCGTAPTAFQNLTMVSSHELAESITDAEVGLSTTIGPPLAWYDTNNGEIGDICNQNQVTLGAFSVQQLWSNGANACITTDTTPPALAFSPPRFVSGTSKISASASGAISAIADVAITLDGKPFAQSSGGSVSAAFDSTVLPDGPVTFVATATNTSKLTASQTANVIVDNTPPTVAVEVPAGAATNLVNLHAIAADALSGVASVDYFVGDKRIGSARQAPYTVAWNAWTFANGAYQVTARATDKAGNTATSAAVEVIVQNTAPRPR